VTVSGAPGVHAAITSSSVGIYINANAGDEVTVRNLVLINAGGTYGIQQVGVGNLRVLDCVLRGFTLAAIEWHVGNLSVDHSTIIDSDPGAGIAIDGTNSGSDVAEMTITNSLIEGYWKGIRARGHASAMVANCTITRGLVGAAAESQDGTGVPASITIEATTITRNSSGIAAIASGANNTAIVYLAQDDVSYNTTGATNIGGSILSFGNNKFTENGSDGGPFAPIALQ
jgi:hypothetical protein